MRKILAIGIFIIVTLSVIMAFVFIRNKTVEKYNDEFESSRENPVNVHFLHWGYFPKEIFSNFSQKYPEINVIYERISENYYPTVQKTRIASGEEMDVMGIMENDYRDYVYRGYLVDLSSKSYLNNYYPDVRETVKSLNSGKKEYAIAYRSWVMGIWYNKILFRKYNLKVPVNYSEFLEVCGKMKANGVNPVVLGARDDWAAGYIYLLRLLKITGNNSTWFADLKQGKAKWTDQEAQSAMSDIEAFIANGYVAEDSINLTYHQAFSEFTRGNAAMTIMADWSINLIKGDTEKVCEPGVIPVPFNDMGTIDKVAGSKAGFLTGIFSESKIIMEADSLMEYLSSVEAARIYSEITISNTTVKGVDTTGIKFNSAWEPLRKMEYIPTGFDEMEGDIGKYLNKSARELLIGSKTSEQILEELQALQEKTRH